MLINVNCSQLEMELRIPFESTAPASQIAKDLITELDLPRETLVTLTMNSKKIDLKQASNTQKIILDSQLEASFTQNVQVTLRNSFQLDNQVNVNLWSNVSSIENSLLSQLYSNFHYEVQFKLDGQTLLRDTLCYAQGVKANSVIQYEIFIEFFALYQNQRIPFKVDAFTKIDDLKTMIKHKFSQNKDVKLKFGELELIEETLFCYSIDPKSDLSVEFCDQPLKQITIILCNESQYTDEREIMVKESDLVAVLDQQIHPSVQYIYKFEGEQLDKRRTFKDQGIGNKTKIRFLALLVGNLIKVFFLNQLTCQMAELEVQPNDYFDEKVQTLLQDEMFTQPNLYCFELHENQQIENLQQTFQQLQINSGDTINYYLRNLKVEVFYQNELHELTFPFNATLANMRSTLQEKLQLTNIEIYQEGAELSPEIELKETYMKPFYIQGEKEQNSQVDQNPKENAKNNQSSFLQGNQIVIIVIQSVQIEIEFEVSKYSTIKQLLIQIRETQGLPPNQPILVSVDGEYQEEETLLLNIFRLEVEIVEFLTVFFQNKQTNETIECQAMFEDQIKIYTDSNKLKNCLFYLNNQLLNIDQSFKDAQIYNRDVISYEIQQQQQQQVIELISFNFRFKRQQSEQLEIVKIENISKDLKVRDLLDNLINQYNLEKDSVLNYQGKKLNEQLSLKDNNVKDNSLIIASPLLISIILQDKNGQKRQKHVRPKQRVSELIQSLAQELNKNQIQLIYNYNLLDGNSTFAELGMVNGSIIELNY